MILIPTQSDLDLFARLSGDANPIHVDPSFAANSGFGRTVAHGAMLTAWLVRASGLLEAPSSTSAMFPAPAFAGEALKATHENSAWELRRVADGVVVCRLQLNSQGSLEETSVITCAANMPLQVGMTVASETSLEADAFQSLQDLQGRAGDAPLSPGAAHAFASQAYILGQISTLLGMHLPGQGTNYLKQETAWLGKILPGERIRTEIVITRLRPEKNLVDLSTQAVCTSGEIVAKGRALVSARDVKGAC